MSDLKNISGLQLNDFEYRVLASVVVDWKDVTPAELDDVRKRLLHAVDGQGGSWTDDDTKFRLGRRFGTRHHLNGCTINFIDGSLRAVRSSDWLNPQTKITCEGVMTATYVRIEFNAGPDKKSEEPLRQPLVVEIHISAVAGTTVTCTNNGDGTGSADGIGRVMNHLRPAVEALIRSALP
jgi:hypothetical protein